MSHYVYGEIEENCTIEQLYRAILEVFPELKNVIEFDPTGKLQVYNYQKGTTDQNGNQLGTCNIRIKGLNPIVGTSTGDSGFTVIDGKIKYSFDNYGPPMNKRYTEMPKKIKYALNRIRVDDEFKKLSLSSSTEDNGDEVVMYTPVSGSQLQELMGFVQSMEAEQAAKVNA